MQWVDVLLREPISTFLTGILCDSVVLWLMTSDYRFWNICYLHACSSWIASCMKNMWKYAQIYQYPTQVSISIVHSGIASLIPMFPIHKTIFMPALDACMQCYHSWYTWRFPTRRYPNLVSWTHIMGICQSYLHTMVEHALMNGWMSSTVGIPLFHMVLLFNFVFYLLLLMLFFYVFFCFVFLFLVACFVLFLFI